MTGPKRNEGATVVGEHTGARSTAKHVRVSSYKVREVLNIIRGLEVQRADEVLQFTERDAANDVRKVLASAVANAVHNEEQDPDELYVRAAFADEGPTLKRFRPRARGRASRIRKRTAHITIIVDRMSDAQLAQKAAKESARSGAPGRGRRVAASTAQSRRDRVASSRAAAAGGGRSSGPSKAADIAGSDEAGADTENELSPDTASDVVTSETGFENTGSENIAVEPSGDEVEAEVQSAVEAAPETTDAAEETEKN